MKLKITLLLLFTINSLLVFSQSNYEPIIKEGSFWDMKTLVITSTCPDNIENIKRIQVAGDTLINSKIYKKLKWLYLEDESDDLCMSPPYYYNPKNFKPVKDQFIREDTNEQRLYILTKLDSDAFQEFTACDFSLNIGDELVNYFGFDNSNSELKLLVDDIKTDENNRKVFYMNDGSYYTEGIGRNEGNLNIYFNLVDGTYERIHCNGNSETTDKCAITLNTNNYQLPPIKVFPNPVSNFLQIKNIQDVTVKVFSINGRLLQTEKFNNEINMNVTDLKTGIYFIEISNLSSRKRLKIIKD